MLQIDSSVIIEKPWAKLRNDYKNSAAISLNRNFPKLTFSLKKISALCSQINKKKPFYLLKKFKRLFLKTINFGSFKLI